MFEFNPEGRRTILSIDGGGMRGVIPLQMLIYLEDQTGKPAYELFDMVAGTSTGAIIAAALGLGYSARWIMDELYMTRLPQAFGSSSGGLFFWLRYLLTGLRHLYPYRPFLEAVKPLTQGKTVAALTHTIMFMTSVDLRTENTYYIVTEGDGAQKFQDWPITGAVAASGAAPIFFPPPLGNFIDGGVGSFGNPCLAASIEAFDYMDFKEEDTLHISLGTGHVPNRYGEGAGSSFWLFNWIKFTLLYPIANAAIDQARNTARFYKKMDFRRYNVELTRENLMTHLNLDPGDIDPRSLGLDTYTTPELELMRRIGQAYAEAIDWKPKYDDKGKVLAVMPWDTKGGRKQAEVKEADWAGSLFE
jgi:hypothetical protein